MRILIFSCYFIFSIACNAQKKLTKSCDISVRVEKSDLDGCDLLLVLPDGRKLLPVNHEEMRLEDGQNVLISYIEEKDMASICMAEDAIVIVTCWQLEGRIPAKKECEDIRDPFESSWLSRIMGEIDPVIIEKYNYRDGFVYICKTSSYNYLYDCQGTLLCVYQAGEQQPCRSKTQELSDKREIWVKHR